MTIFMINTPKAVPVSKPVEGSPQAATPDAAPIVAKPGEQHEEMDDDLQKAREIDGEEASGENVAEKQVKTREAKLISIDGPVSRIYSAALQEVFANEGMAAMLQDLGGNDSGIGIDGDPVVRGDSDDLVHQSAAGLQHTQVFSYTADTLNLQDVVKISDHITKNMGRNYIVAVEGVTGNHRAASMLEEMERAGRLRLCLSRGAAISAIVNAAKS